MARAGKRGRYLNLRLDVGDGIALLDIDGDGLARQRFDEDLLVPTT